MVYVRQRESAKAFISAAFVSVNNKKKIYGVRHLDFLGEEIACMRACTVRCASVCQSKILVVRLWVRTLTDLDPIDAQHWDSDVMNILFIHNKHLVLVSCCFHSLDALNANFYFPFLPFLRNKCDVFSRHVANASNSIWSAFAFQF